MKPRRQPSRDRTAPSIQYCETSVNTDMTTSSDREYDCAYFNFPHDTLSDEGCKENTCHLCDGSLSFLWTMSNFCHLGNSFWLNTCLLNERVSKMWAETQKCLNGPKRLDF